MLLIQQMMHCYDRTYIHHIYYDILGVYIFHYYSSNSITSNPTVFTGVITSVCRQTNTCACLVTLAKDVVETATTCSCAVFCALFLASFLNFRCLNITTLFNIDVKKYVLVPLRLPAALLPFCAVVVHIYLLQHVFKVFQSTFSHLTVQFRRVTTELCNFDPKQSNLCCFDGFRTLYCCVNADVSFCNYYHSNLSRLFSKASVTVILLRFS